MTTEADNFPDSRLNAFGPSADVNQMFQLVLDSIPIRVFWKDKNAVYLGSNQIFAEDAGFASPDEIIGKTDFELGWSRKQAEDFRTDDFEVMQSGVAKLHIEEPQNHSDGKTHWLETNKIPLTDTNGQVIGVLGTYGDITDRKNHEKDIEYLATHDELTGLKNRHYLKTYIANAEPKSMGSQYGALFFVDLDQFKAVNDTLGHLVGDKLLQEVGRRISAVAGRDPLVTRLGGDEFGILSPQLGAEKEIAEQTAFKEAKEYISSIAAPYFVNGHRLYIGASVGISMISAIETDLQNKLEQADIAMYVAKASGRGMALFYNAEMSSGAARRHLMQIRLRQAVDQGDFGLVYQPQFNQNEKLVGCEVLLRWNDLVLGPVSPAEFIPLAEQTGLIHEIGDWVFGAAFSQLATWLGADRISADFRMAINISATQFKACDLVQRVVHAAERFGIDPKLIELEITESLPLELEGQMLQDLSDLSDAGFQLVMDDFGTGFSNLNYLTRMPLSKIKIDRSFVTQIGNDVRHTQIARTIMEMAKSLELQVIAEGVETTDERRILIEMGCEYFQGFLYSPGQSAEDFERFFA